MELWILGYLWAVLGSFVARIIWWRADYQMADIWQELRIGWKQYFKEDLTAGLALALRFLATPLSDGLMLEHQSRAVDHLLNQVARERGFPSYWDAPAEARPRIEACAKSQLETQLLSFDEIVEGLAASQRKAKKVAWATAMVTWIHCAPLQLSKALVAIAHADGGVITTVTVVGPTGSKRPVGLMWWDLPGGNSRLDCRWTFHQTEQASTFVQLRSDGGGKRFGLGAYVSCPSRSKLRAGVLLRAFTNGTRGSPGAIHIWPSASYQVTPKFSVGGHAFYNLPFGKKGNWSYGPTAGLKLGKNDSLGLTVYQPGAVYELDYVHSIPGW